MMAFKLALGVLGLGLFLTTTATAQQRDTTPSGDATPDSVVVAPPTAARVAPIQLKIPALMVDAEVTPVGPTDDGAMDVPKDPDTVAWWSLGYGTGEPGNVVLAAHVDWDGRLRVFGLLHRLVPGDAVVVVDELAREFWYKVTWTRRVPVEGAPLDEIFGSRGEHELTLITCGGEFDQASRQYLDRVIVRAHQI
jgi:LPXTG-site transpeptidase (sortase) family protein